MRTDLLPMSMGDVFDEAFDLYKRNFALLAGVVAILYVPATLALSAVILGMDTHQFRGDPNSPEALTEAFGMMFALLGVGLVYYLFFIVQSAALTIAVSDRHLNRPVTMGLAYRRMLPHLLRLLVTWFLAVCIFAVVFLGFFIVMALIVGVFAAATTGGGRLGETASIAIGLIAILVPGVLVAGFVAGLALFTVQIVVIEGGGYLSAFQRNWQLVKGRFWPTLGFALMLLVFTNAMSLAIAGSVNKSLDFLLYSWMPVSSLTQRIILTVIQGAVGLFVQPFAMVCITLLYYDRRVRREGFDLSLLARHLESQQVGEAPA